MNQKGRAASLPVPAIARGARLLKALVARGDGASLTDLAVTCEIAKSTASNLLRSMLAEGFVGYDPVSRRYQLGPVLVELGVAALAHATPLSEARPHMERLAEQTKLAVLAIQPMPDGHFTAVSKIESQRNVKITIGVGERFPPTAPLLSGLAAAWPSPFTAEVAQRTDTVDVQQFRALGYGAVFGGYIRGLNVVGFPVFDRDGFACLFVALLGIGDDLVPDEVSSLADELVASSRNITSRTGGILPRDFPAA